jgi:hypothetical protein
LTNQRVEAIRDRLLTGLGWASDRLIEQDQTEMRWVLGREPWARQWRKPLRPDEIAQIRPAVPEVLSRPGRP